MEYSDDYLREYLPRENPLFDFVPGDVLRELEVRGDRVAPGEDYDFGLVRRSTQWTYAMFSELGVGQYRLRGLGPWFELYDRGHSVSIGLYDKDWEKPGFGLCANVPPYDGPPFDIWGEIEFPRLKIRVPFAVRSVLPELHAALHPQGATSACWGKSNAKGLWGIVTAAHAVGTNAGGLSILMDDGSTGISEPSFWQPIDAAHVLTPAPMPQPTPLQVAIFPATGDRVTVETRKGPEARVVASACNSLGFYRTRSFPVLFFLDKPCAPGDSGALVRLASGEACGIYCGSEPSPDTGGVSGRALNFAQAMFVLDTAPYL